jgi:hypothetical protein
MSRKSTIILWRVHKNAPRHDSTSTTGRPRKAPAPNTICPSLPIAVSHARCASASTDSDLYTQDGLREGRSRVKGEREGRHGELLGARAGEWARIARSWRVREGKEWTPSRAAIGRRPQRRGSSECWIITTDMSLVPREIREAAHLRWHVENNVFKRLSKQSGTKRFHFKDPTRLYSLLRLFCAAVALFDMLIAILQREQKQFKRILDGIKVTWNNIFSQLAELLGGFSRR